MCQTNQLVRVGMSHWNFLHPFLAAWPLKFAVIFFSVIKTHPNKEKLAG
jgi:hypothetical protein